MIKSIILVLSFVGLVSCACPNNRCVTGYVWTPAPGGGGQWIVQYSQ